MFCCRLNLLVRPLMTRPQEDAAVGEGGGILENVPTTVRHSLRYAQPFQYS